MARSKSQTRSKSKTRKTSPSKSPSRRKPATPKSEPAKKAAAKQQARSRSSSRGRGRPPKTEKTPAKTPARSPSKTRAPAKAATPAKTKTPTTVQRSASRSTSRSRVAPSTATKATKPASPVSPGVETMRLVSESSSRPSRSTVRTPVISSRLFRPDSQSRSPTKIQSPAAQNGGCKIWGGICSTSNNACNFYKRNRKDIWITIGLAIFIVLLVRLIIHMDPNAIRSKIGQLPDLGASKVYNCINNLVTRFVEFFEKK